MSRTIRFPLQKAVPSVGPAELSLVLPIVVSATTLVQGGGTYRDVTPWKNIQRNTESPFSCVVIEVTADAALVIGDGTFAQQIGLYGSFFDSVNTEHHFLLGILGVARGGVAPQIPITTTDSGATIVGYSQIVHDVALYDKLAVGGVAGDITISGGHHVDITARPIRTREYMG